MRTYKKMYEDAAKGKALKQLTPTYLTWDKEGDQIIGAFISKMSVQSRLGGPEYNQYLFETDEGLVKFALGRAADGELSELFTRGNVYAIIYQGKESIGHGRSVNRFSVEEIGVTDELREGEGILGSGVGGEVDQGKDVAAGKKR